MSSSYGLNNNKIKDRDRDREKDKDNKKLVNKLRTHTM